MLLAVSDVILLVSERGAVASAPGPRPLVAGLLVRAREVPMQTGRLAEDQRVGQPALVVGGLSGELAGVSLPFL